MKIKTITCHEVYNHGASLQEYALLKYLQELGHDVETISYKPDYLGGHFDFLKVSNDKYAKNILLKIAYLAVKFPTRLKNLKRKRSFDAFSMKYIKSTEKTYYSNQELLNDVPVADTYICGSDQIWNSFFQNGKDPAFYLDFVPDGKRKISYAASFAIEKLAPELTDFVKEKVSRLDSISVRESSGVDILKSLGFHDVTQVLDPVFLLDKNVWNDLMETPENKCSYVFIYDFDSNPLIKDMAFNLKDKFGYDIITVNENITYADKNYFLDGPSKFLTLVKNAEFVISNSFHAVAFSILFEKKFVVFNRMYKINTRMRDLLKSIDLPELLIESEEQMKKFDNSLVDYTKSKVKLNGLIEKSKHFLTLALADKN
ncbi:polysaccharide pyruvyl transferase family protein [Aquimarina sp. 2-A2]|uniref:polysaccharide pyruvyl transferase family protein n=1 Tax=Aquimarina sp. 2-A2 TaxID=3382644 RepID=UPI00387EF99C